MQYVFLLLIAVALTSCGKGHGTATPYNTETRIQWQGGDQAKLALTDYECERDAKLVNAGEPSKWNNMYGGPTAFSWMASASPDKQMYFKCMTAHGYTPVEITVPVGQ